MQDTDTSSSGFLCRVAKLRINVYGSIYMHYYDVGMMCSIDRYMAIFEPHAELLKKEYVSLRNRKELKHLAHLNKEVKDIQQRRAELERREELELKRVKEELELKRKAEAECHVP